MTVNRDRRKPATPDSIVAAAMLALLLCIVSYVDSRADTLDDQFRDCWGSKIVDLKHPEVKHRWDDAGHQSTCPDIYKRWGQRKDVLDSGCAAHCTPTHKSPN